MSKENILGLSFYPEQIGSAIECVTKKDALEAMDIFAKQTAIEFHNWLDKQNYTKQYIQEAYWYSFDKPIVGKQTEFTIDQLFELFLEQKTYFNKLFPK